MRKENILIIINITIFLLLTSCNNSVSNENLDDINKIKIGMHFNEVKEIMRNPPFKQDIYDFEPDEFVSLYDSPVSSSGNFSITYSKFDSIVKRVYRGN